MTGQVRAGRFITFEGGEGAGKTVQARLLVEHLRRDGREVIATREPGGVPVAETLRGLLVDPAVARWDPVGELLLLGTARRAHLTQLVWPALARGSWVVCDRFVDSTRAYQGGGHGLDDATIIALHRLVADGRLPDLTFLIDLPVAEGLERAFRRSLEKSRFERLGLEFHERVHAAFQRIAAAEPERVRVLDGGGSPDAIHAAVLATLAERFPGELPP